MRRLALVLALTALSACGGDDDDAPAVDARVADSGAQITPCVPVGAPGNVKKVGMYCTRGGGECARNGAGNATICAIDFDSNPEADTNFCTKSCVDALSCGPDSVCIGDRPNATTTGCVPNSCAPSWAFDGGI